MTEVTIPNIHHKARSGLHFSRLRLIMVLCLLDLLAPFLTLLRAFGLSLETIIPVAQPVILIIVLAVTQKFQRRALFPFTLLLVLFFLSFLKSFALTGVEDFHFKSRAVISYFYSLSLPLLTFTSIFSMKENDPHVVYDELVWFSKWFFYISAPISITYFIVHTIGLFPYFGFGINFHYFAPFFFHKNMAILSIAALILIGGKRSVLINFSAQLGLYFFDKMQKRPVEILALFGLVALITLLTGDELAFLFRRFEMMTQVIDKIDLSAGLFSIADTYDAIILFGGRLEEVVGVTQYFQEHPEQIWFGSPPGANYLWRIEYSDLYTYKSFAHLTWVAYVFRYGVVTSAILLITLLFFLFQGANLKNPLWLVYLGTLTSATFGANLLGSPTAWIMIALYVRYGRQISRSVI